LEEEEEGSEVMPEAEELAMFTTEVSGWI